MDYDVLRNVFVNTLYRTFKKTIDLDFVRPCTVYETLLLGTNKFKKIVIFFSIIQIEKYNLKSFCYISITS